MTMSINQIIKHIRDREYMSGVERDFTRIKSTGEVFTPTIRVQKELDKIEKINPNSFVDVSNTFVDPGCGDGQFLGEVLIRKIENSIDFESALSTIYGVDLMQDNVDLCRERLLCARQDLRHIVEKNIVCADALRYHYRFDGSHPYDDEVKAKQKEDLLNSLFE
jgi:SAM-dependent methyltransferase